MAEKLPISGSMDNQRKLHVLVHPNSHAANDVDSGAVSFSNSPGKCNDAPKGRPIGCCEETGNVTVAPGVISPAAFLNCIGNVKVADRMSRMATLVVRDSMKITYHLYS